MSRFLGGTPGTVAMRLLVVSFVVGLLLAMLGFDPESILEVADRTFRHLVAFGLGDLRQLGRILLTGAIIVVPVWFVLRLMDRKHQR